MGNPSASASPSPSPSPSSSAPTLQELAAMGGAGAIATSGPDVWGTGNYGDMPVVLGKVQSGGPTGFFASILGGQMEGGNSQKAPTSAQQRLLDRSKGVGSAGRFVPKTFSDTTATVNDVLKDGYNHDSAWVQQLQQKLWLAGMYQGTGVSSPSQIPYGTYDEATILAYGNLLKASAAQYARGQDVSIDSTLSDLIQQRTATGQLNANGQTTRSSTSYSLSDPETAKAILTNVFQAYEGIGIPDPGTVSAFQQALNDYEKAHPSTTTSTYSSDGSGTDTSSEGVNGLSAAGRTQFAQDYLMQHQGGQVANYQAATTYFNAAMQALHSPVSLGGNG